MPIIEDTWSRPPEYGALDTGGPLGWQARPADNEYWYPVPGHPNGGVFADDTGRVWLGEREDPVTGEMIPIWGSIEDVLDTWPDPNAPPKGGRGSGGPGRNYGWETGEREASQAWQSEEDLRRRIWENDQRLGSQNWRSGESFIDRGFQNDQRIGGQNWRSGESDLDRSQRAGEFAANYQLGRAANQRANMQLGLQGAGQVASLISSVDPGALPAFLAAGGGNISNAISRGRTAVTPNANLGAARTLRTMDQPLMDPGDYTYQPGTNPYVDPNHQVQERTNPYANQPDFNGNTGAQDMLYRQVEPPQQRPSYQKPPGYAQGGMTRDSMFLGNEQGAEMFVNPTQAPIGVVPADQTKQMLGMGMMGGMMQGRQMMPGYALGTGLIQPEDTPYLGQINDIRQGVRRDLKPPIAGGIYNAAYNLQSPTARARYMQGLQTGYGIPVEDVMQEQARYQLGGLGRGQRAIGY